MLDVITLLKRVIIISIKYMSLPLRLSLTGLITGPEELGFFAVVYVAFGTDAVTSQTVSVLK